SISDIIILSAFSTENLIDVVKASILNVLTSNVCISVD
ncbi:unnamed protein product, partial [Rotaria sp. Silwood2]